MLVANVEEARYDALVGEDGKLLVRARYAVRNNQRSFLAVTLPPQSVLWSASLAGRPVRPGVSAGRRPAAAAAQGAHRTRRRRRSSSSCCTCSARAAWTEKGDAHLELPAVDLPVSRTGLTLHHSPRYDVEPQPGAFRVESDRGSVERRAARSRRAAAAPPPPPRRRQRAAEARREGSSRSLMDRFQKEAGRTRQGVIPIAIAFPAIGPSVFLAAELTPETQSPSVDIRLSQDAGGR